MTTLPSSSWVRSATSLDWDGIAQLLTERRLPTEGARDHLAAFVVATEGRALLGCAGLERYGDVGLLRSVAVAENAGDGASVPRWCARRSSGPGRSGSASSIS
jgi:N-acetylglutamate synthase-like GNAT family acetyltransferase